ncbi:SirB2 family protein [Sediminicurvatus halobius]|uniref:Regulator SirB n=1 Tax=Sediminicurvatus halobius TaxID=2182432 RepID=A0A2U2N6W9_9GAMM|nr:SirB2 family protein [Spiribacter halobius]PWG64807.1 regulator SirB [Spiribacter halobius]UEX78339.1 SirB2 family protein [Spiribacter halobius]
MGYMIAKHLHTTAVALTLILFLVRGAWMFADSGMLQRKWVRIVPHVIDTVLLLSALYLAIAVWGWPATFHGWITAKLLALIAYIVLGTIALKRGRTKGVRSAAFVGALLVFAYLVAVALSKQVVPV